MQFFSTLPDPVLQDYIHFYWIGNIFIPEAEGLTVSVQPITMQNLLFFTDDVPFRMNGEKKEEMAPCTLIGMISKPSTYLLKGRVKIIGVRFKPAGFSRMFYLRPEEFTNRASDFRLVLKVEMDELSDKIESHKSDNIRLKLLDDYFKNKLKALLPVSKNQKTIQRAINKIEATNGNIKINTLANEALVSERHFRRIFLEATGLNPKEFAEITRYNEAYKLILAKPQRDWFDIIHKCGYHDQAHFIHDFKKYTGRLPSKYKSNFKEFDSFHR